MRLGLGRPWQGLEEERKNQVGRRLGAISMALKSSLLPPRGAKMSWGNIAIWLEYGKALSLACVKLHGIFSGLQP